MQIADQNGGGIALAPVGCLVLLWPALTDVLASPARQRRAEHAAERFAPIARMAVELRLAEGDAALDLHQLVTRQDGEPALLLRHLECRSSTSAREDPVWRFLREWGSGADRLSAIDRIFLEWDDPGDGDGDRDDGVLPSIFLPVDSRRGNADARRAHRDLIRHLVAELRPEGAEGPALDALGKGLGGDMSISHIGVMVGREAGIRINVRRVRRGELRPLLDRIGWRGDREAATMHFDALVACTDRLTVAFDLASELLPTIGFEAFLDGHPESEPRWRLLLDHLAAHGLCTPDKRNALLSVHRNRFPEAPGQPWPAQWIVATASSRPDRLPWFECNVSHVKLSLASDGRASAKAYVAGQHHWTRAVAAPVKAVRSRNHLDARRAAVDFLLAARGQDDLWGDFRLVNGIGDEWISAFVGCSLVSEREVAAGNLLQRTLEALLARQRPQGGWGYNRFSPPDADSTAWVLKFMRDLRHHGPALHAAETFLRQHVRADGGLATYAPATPIRIGSSAHNEEAPGWRASHACVLANAAGLLGGALQTALRDRQQADGAWTAYWWRNDIYATALALHALDGAPNAEGARLRAARWARGCMADARSPFDRAWLAQILARGDASDRTAAHGLLMGLIEDQNEDGSWRGGAEMLFPPQSRIERDPATPSVLDQCRVFTTASVLMALKSDDSHA
jgi:squalene-hopene/tetraprenyl-beta-curcumene cyclase